MVFSRFCHPRVGGDLKPSDVALDSRFRGNDGVVTSSFLAQVWLWFLRQAWQASLLLPLAS